jgi:hypothetical protein
MDTAAGGHRSTGRADPHSLPDWNGPLTEADGSRAGARRAPRYLMDLEVRYRAAGAPDWSEGRTIDISRCGALFAAAGPLLPALTPVELLIAMPGSDSVPGARVHCKGRIVRLVPLSPLMAATIDDYSFEKAGEHP